MTISKKQLQQRFFEGRAIGQEEGKREAAKEFNESKVHAQKEIMRAAAELAQANAKLTYAMSRMITGGN